MKRVRIVVTTPEKMDEVLCRHITVQQALDDESVTASVEIDVINVNDTVERIRTRGYNRVHALRDTEVTHIFVGVQGVDSSTLIDQLVALALLAYSKSSV